MSRSLWSIVEFFQSVDHIGSLSPTDFLHWLNLLQTLLSQLIAWAFSWFMCVPPLWLVRVVCFRQLTTQIGKHFWHIDCLQQPLFVCILWVEKTTRVYSLTSELLLITYPKVVCFFIYLLKFKDLFTGRAVVRIYLQHLCYNTSQILRVVVGDGCIYAFKNPFIETVHIRSSEWGF